MGFRIGVVCEGSHDFNVLRQFIDLIIRQSGETVDEIVCLQPSVSATFQIGGGGWTQVQAWCRFNNGEGYRIHLDQPLFSTSKPCDLLVIHLDGDVVTHCEAQPLTGLSVDTLSVADVVAKLKTTITGHWLNLLPDHVPRIVSCIPVRHLEAWLSAAIGPAIASPELVDMKEPFRQGPASTYKGAWRDKYIRASKDAIKSVGKIRASCVSFNVFESDLSKSINQI